MADPADKKKWLVDEEAATVVKRIFDLCIAGKEPMQIANWEDSSIIGILKRMDYCGHTVNFKSYSKFHNLKKRIPTTKEHPAVFYNTHEAIVENAVFEQVQELRANKRRPTKADRQGLFVLRLGVLCGLWKQATLCYL